MAFFIEAQDPVHRRRRRTTTTIAPNTTTAAPTTTTAAQNTTAIGSTKGLARANLFDVLFGSVPTFCNDMPSGAGCPLVNRTEMDSVFYYDSNLNVCLQTQAACIQENNTFYTMEECLHTCYRTPVLADLLDLFTTTTAKPTTTNTTVIANTTTIPTTTTTSPP